MAQLKAHKFHILFFILMFGLGFVFHDDVTNAFRGQTESLDQASLVGMSAEVLAKDIYKGGKKLAKVSVKLAQPLLAKYAVDKFLDDVPLNEEVKKRVLERLKKPDLVDEIVPFLISLKNQYTVPKDSTVETFDDSIRKFLTQDVPGVNHTLFTLKPPVSTEAKEASKFDHRITAALVSVYDILFIQAEVSPLKADKPVSDTTVKKLTPIIENLLNGLKENMKDNADLSEGLTSILSDKTRVETITITLATAITQEAHKAYSIFAQKAERSAQLKAWLWAEYKKPAYGKFWQYLEQNHMNRKNVVLVAVDGLQGHLLETLSNGKSSNEFLKKIVRDQKPVAKPFGKKVSAPTVKQLTAFLDNMSQEGYQNPKYLPFFKWLYSENKKRVVENGVSTTPTISVRNLPIIKTGAPVTGPHSTGIPNFHFVDRKKQRAFYFYGNDALLLEPLTKEAGMMNLHQRFSHLTSLNCGAQYDMGAYQSFNPFLGLALGEKVRDFGDRLCMQELMERLANEKELQNARKEIIKLKSKIVGFHLFKFVTKEKLEDLIDKLVELEDSGIPQILTYYNPWPDHFAHGKGPFSDEIISPSGELARLDYWLASITSLYRDAGVYENTLFGMAGDHGLSPVYWLLNPEIEVFEALKKEGYKNLVIEKISSDEGEGPKMNHPIRPPSMKKKDVVIASTAGGNYMMDFFLNQTDKWGVQPLLSDLKSWKTLDGNTINIISEILRRLGNSLEYMAVRETPCNHEGGATRLLTNRFGTTQSALILRKSNKVFYESTTDLLGVSKTASYLPVTSIPSEYKELLAKCVQNAKRDLESSWCTEKEWLVLTSYTEKPDSVAQLSHLFDSDRAGTVNLFPVFGVGYNSKVPGRHAGEDFHEKDAFVGFWGGPAKPGKRIKSAVNGSMPATLIHYLYGKPGTEEEGVGYPSLLRELTP